MSFRGKQPNVERVKYDGLSSHPSNALTGDTYFNTGAGSLEQGLYRYDGSNWNLVSEFVDSRNFIVNGAMEIAQRQTSFSGATSGSASINMMIADRFRFVVTDDSTLALSQNTDFPASEPELRVCSRLSVSTNDASVGAAQSTRLRTAIEGYDFRQIREKQVTLSFWVKASITGTFGVRFTNTAGDRSYVTTYSISSADTWERKTVTLTIDTASGTWNYTTGAGLIIDWAISSGSDFQTATVDAWQNGNFHTTSSQTQLTQTNGANWNITGVSLNIGPRALKSFKYSLDAFTADLDKCRRYYQKSYPIGNSPGSGSIGGYSIYEANGHASATYTIRLSTRFQLEMLSAPSVTVYDFANGFSGNVTVASGYVSGTVENAVSTGFAVSAVDGVSGTTRKIQYHWEAVADFI